MPLADSPFICQKRLKFAKNNFDYCICFHLNLCYGVYIPVMEAAKFAPSPAGISLRHWPPGTNSLTVRAAFFLPSGVLRAGSRTLLADYFPFFITLGTIRSLGPSRTIGEHPSTPCLM
jgi:hypothetical protein